MPGNFDLLLDYFEIKEMVLFVAYHLKYTTFLMTNNNYLFVLFDTAFPVYGQL